MIIFINIQFRIMQDSSHSILPTQTYYDSYMRYTVLTIVTIKISAFCNMKYSLGERYKYVIFRTDEY